MNAKLANALQASLYFDTIAFVPQLVLCAGILLLLLIRLVPRYDRWHLGWLALTFAAGACFLSCSLWLERTNAGSALAGSPGHNHTKRCFSTTG